MLLGCGKSARRNYRPAKHPGGPAGRVRDNCHGNPGLWSPGCSPRRGHNNCVRQGVTQAYAAARVRAPVAVPGHDRRSADIPSWPRWVPRPAGHPVPDPRRAAPLPGSPATGTMLQDGTPSPPEQRDSWPYVSGPKSYVRGRRPFGSRDRCGPDMRMPPAAGYAAGGRCRCRQAVVATGCAAIFEKTSASGVVRRRCARPSPDRTSRNAAPMKETIAPISAIWPICQNP